MRWDFGSVYKDIRRSKHISQERVCQDMISRSNLSRIEANQVMPSFETMDYLLNQINMTFDEFRYICHLYRHSQREEILLLANQNHKYNTTESLQELKELAEQYLHSHPFDIPIQTILKQITIILSIRQTGPSQESKELSQLAWEEIKNQDTWYKSDLEMLVVILLALPLDTIITICDEVLERLKDYKDYVEIVPIKYSLLANLSSVFLWNNLMDRCTHISQMLLTVAHETKRYDHLGAAQVRLGICLKDEELINKGLQLLELTEETVLFKACQEEAELFYFNKKA